MLRNRTLASVLIVAGLALGLAACKSEEKKADKGGSEMQKAAFNTMCPVSDEPVDPAAPTRQYAGKTVGFCCDHCPAKWDKATVAERDAMLAKIAAK